MIKNIKWLLLVSLITAACSSNEEEYTGIVPEKTPSAGTADFSKYVALGDSFAAGFSDNALFKAGQQNAYPNILAQQLALAGGGSFTTPFMVDNVGGFSMGGAQMTQFPTRLFFNGSAPVNVPGVSGTVYGDQLTGAFNNMGIPGAKSFHLTIPGYGSMNPYFGRFDSSASASVIGDAVAQNPTFFSLWIGGNDVLSYASSGGAGRDQTGNMDPSTYGTNDITDPTVFGNVYSGLITALTANGAKGVVANLPYINTLPYFTTVPYNPVPLDANTAALLNSGYAQYNAGLQMAQGAGLLSADEAASRKIQFEASSNNKVVIIDEYLTDLSGMGIPSYRQATKDDLLVLSARTIIGTTVGGNPLLINGVSVPLADNWVLTKNEIAEIRVATDAYNATIKGIAEEKGLAFVDTKAIMEQLVKGGIRYGNFHMTNSYVTGGVFSLDGVHPSARGYAMIADYFAKAIEVAYDASIPNVKVANFPMHYPMIMN